MICTGNYQNCQNGRLVSIQGDRGLSVGFTGEYYSSLAPKRVFWNVWKENIGKISEEENNRYYIEQFYLQVLKKLDPIKVLKELGHNPILLCEEENDQFCHRHIVAFWLEEMLGMIVPEIKIDKCGKYTVLDRPQWIKEILLEVMNQDRLGSGKCKIINQNF